DPTRIVIVGLNSIYESLDRGDTLTEIGPGQGGGLPRAVAYGGRRSGVANLAVLYVGSGHNLLVRTASGGSLTASATYPGTTVVGVVMDPNDWMHAFVIDFDALVFETTDAGGSWTNVTGNLSARPLTLGGVVYVPTVPNDQLIVGTAGGVFVSFRNN